MEETYLTKIIVLSKEVYREADARVSAYSLYRGRMNLVVRGALKPASKLSGHLEPLNEAEVMVIRGRRFDYVGGARNFLAGRFIRTSLEKTRRAWTALYLLDRAVAREEPDREIYFLLKDFLSRLEKGAAAEADFWLNAFIWKLSARLGFTPELEVCLQCGRNVRAGKVFFRPAAGGLVCAACHTPADLACPTPLAAWLKEIIFRPGQEINYALPPDGFFPALQKINRAFIKHHLAIDFF